MPARTSHRGASGILQYIIEVSLRLQHGRNAEDDSRKHGYRQSEKQDSEIHPDLAQTGNKINIGPNQMNAHYREHKAQCSASKSQYQTLGDHSLDEAES